MRARPSSRIAVADTGVSVALAIVSALAVCACGVAHRDPAAHAASSPAPAAEQPSAARGGTLTVFAPGGLESIDPAVARSQQGRALMNATQRPLFSYQPGVSATPSPDLAAQSADVSADGQTVTVHVRAGVHFSPPVNREVTSYDVAYAIERGANPNVASPYFARYFSTVDGAEHAHGGPIRGIVTPDRHTIVFHLDAPSGRLVADALTLPISAPVPRGYARRYDAMRPSRYGEHQVATGPYMLRARGGDVLGVGYRPGREAVLIRNPNWRAATDFRPAYLDRIEIRFGGSPGREAHAALLGSSIAMDEPPRRALGEAAHEHPAQVRISPGAGVGYIALDNAHGPFADVDLRKALWAALDRVALGEVATGGVSPQVASHFLYPGMPGFGLANERLAGRGLSYDEHPRGDIALARRYLRHAGYKAGAYTGKNSIAIVGVEEVKGAVSLVARTLQSLGFRTRARVVSERQMYSSYCGVPAKKIDVCLGAPVHADFADGQLLFGPTFNGRRIKPTGNENWSQVDLEDLNLGIEHEAAVVASEQREQGWSAVDSGLVQFGTAIPYAWTRGAALSSANVLGVADLWNAGAWDYSFTSLRSPRARRN